MTKIALIVAVAENGVIGNNNSLPWYLPADLHHFKQTTLNKPIIMGRKTWQSLGKALPNRLNIILSCNKIDNTDVTTCINLIDAFEVADNWLKQQKLINSNQEDEIMIIGGANVYAQALPYIHKIYLTRVLVNPAGDTFFPYFDNLNCLNFKQIKSDFYEAKANFPAYILEEYILPNTQK